MRPNDHVSSQLERIRSLSGFTRDTCIPFFVVGFAIGLERLALMLGEASIAPPRPELFIATLGEAATKAGFAMLTRLQREGILVEMEYTGKSLKAQLRRADKLNTRRVLILGEDELARGVAQLRSMDESLQEEVALEGLETRLLSEIHGA